MVDFISILKKAIEGLNDDGPEVRERVYRRARVTLSTRLALIGPPPATVVERHTRLLDEAIATVENWYIGQRHDLPGNRAVAHGDNHRDACEQVISEDEATGETQPELSKGPPEQSSPERSECPESGGRASANPIKVGFEPSDDAGSADGSRRVVAEGSAEAEAIGLVELTKAFACNLEWPGSSRCGICLKWATCIDLEQCWNRADEGTLALEPAA